MIGNVETQTAINAIYDHARNTDMMMKASSYRSIQELARARQENLERQEQVPGTSLKSGMNLSAYSATDVRVMKHPVHEKKFSSRQEPEELYTSKGMAQTSKAAGSILDLRA